MARVNLGAVPPLSSARAVTVPAAVPPPGQPSGAAEQAVATDVAELSGSSPAASPLTPARLAIFAATSSDPADRPSAELTQAWPAVPSEEGSRNTLGWAGEPGLNVPFNQTHRRQVQLGLEAMDRIAPGFRKRFEQLLSPDVDPQLKSSLDALVDEQNNLLCRHGKLLSQPEERLQPQQRQQRQQIESRLAELAQSYEQVERQLQARGRENLERARELARVFLQKLRDGKQVRDVFEHVQVDPSAARQLQNAGVSEQTFRGWINQFHHQAGLPAPRQLRFRYTEKRPNYDCKADAINVGEKFSRRLALHEIAHRLEYLHPEISLANKSWVLARSQNGGFAEDPVKLQQLVPKGDYQASEVAREDSFIDPYVGKVYPDMATEVLSVGLEHMADEKLFVKLYQRDPEHLFLTLGALQVLNKEKW